VASGHYFAYVRRPIDEANKDYKSGWVCVSDEDTENVGYDRVSDAEAYMLFYQKMYIGRLVE
jgi:ubiquitin C-terminal hydrolase